MMPETYTQEQIDEAMKFLRGITSDSETMNSSIMILLSALSTADAERDALKARCAELEARLQGAADRAVKFIASIGGDAAIDDGLRAAIVGKKEG
jgi:hypothetical protein